MTRVLVPVAIVLLCVAGRASGGMVDPNDDDLLRIVDVHAVPYDSARRLDVRVQFNHPPDLAGHDQFGTQHEEFAFYIQNTPYLTGDDVRFPEDRLDSFIFSNGRVAGIENLAVGSLVVLDRNRAGIKAIIPTEIDRSTVSFSATYDQLNLKNGRLTYQLEAEVNQGTTDVRIGTVVPLPSAVWTAAPLLLLLSTLGIGGHANAGRRVL